MLSLSTHIHSAARPRFAVIYAIVACACAAWFASPLVKAQSSTAITEPVPLGAKTVPIAPGAGVALELDAQRALEMGLPSIAVELYRKLLDTPAAAAGAVHDRVTLGLVSALLQDDRVSEAAQVMEAYSGDISSPSWRLRRAMIDARQRRFDATRNIITAMKPEDLPAEEKSWLYFLRGMLADETRDLNQAGAMYQQAETSAVTPVQRAWFVLNRIRVRLFLGDANESIVTSLRQTMERNAGRVTGYTAASQLAVVLNMLGRRPEAVVMLQTQLQALSSQETGIRDEWLFLIGVIGGADSPDGYNALKTLLSTSVDTDKQRAALRLMANASATPASKQRFGDLLNTLIAATPPHPILEDLLLFRAQLALSDKDNKNFLVAERDATRLRDEFPGSELRASAFGVLTAVAWEQRRYRAAASQATGARAIEGLVPLVRAQLGVLIAEAWFRAKDFRNAADAYASALTDVPAGVSAGDLMFQRVLSEMSAPGGLAGAQTLLDQLSSDPRFDAVNRWRSEWNLARALQGAGEIQHAYNRLNRLLAEPSAKDLSPGLRARMGWLQARLAYESNKYEESLGLAKKLLSSLDGVDAGLRADIASTTLLLEAQAEFALNEPSRVNAAMDLLRKLRTEYTKSDAAVYSYIVEADAAAKRGQLVEAQGLLRKLADDYRDTPYAPYALYQAALYAERRAQDQYYKEAYRILEYLVTEYKDSDLVFHARLKQGNLLRLLNDYGAARTVYEDLVNRYKYPQYEEALTAELALADCYAALAATDASRAESAAAIYERLLDQQSAPPDLRVEAGYKFGLNLISRGAYARLEAVWWPMINSLLLDDTQAAKLGARGRYWMSRTLVKLGEVLEQQSKVSQAREVYELIVSKDLPGAALAQDRISKGK